MNKVSQPNDDIWKAYDLVSLVIANATVNNFRVNFV